jgi:hypothetical protein
MKILENYLKIIYESENNNNDITDKIIEFFQNNPNPSDDMVHDYAEEIGMDPDNLEEKIYELLTSLVNLKGSNIPDNKFDSEQLKMGIEVEKEHHDNPIISKAISKAHLNEDPKYYTKLKKIEEEAGIKD